MKIKHNDLRAAMDSFGLASIPLKKVKDASVICYDVEIWIKSKEALADIDEMQTQFNDICTRLKEAIKTVTET